MNTRVHSSIFVGVAMLSLLSSASPAQAACADISSYLQRGGADGRGPIAPAARLIANDKLIVGLWQFRFTSVGNDVAPVFIPDGAPLDDGYAQWHEDGTEIMNSFRDPATSNFCLGVYASTAVRSVHLNHFALSWDNTGQLCTPAAGQSSCFVGRTNIQEDVTVDKQGDTYSGTVTIDQYDQNGQHMFRLHGNVAARRISAIP
jgi:hypothetical protein